jgi:hypothetical protein
MVSPAKNNMSSRVQKGHATSGLILNYVFKHNPATQRCWRETISREKKSQLLKTVQAARNCPAGKNSVNNQPLRLKT